MSVPLESAGCLNKEIDAENVVLGRAIVYLLCAAEAYSMSQAKVPQHSYSKTLVVFSE